LNYIHKDESALYYECGYSCDNAIFLKLGSESFFLTDGRCEIEAREQVSNSVEVIIDRDIIKRANRLLRKSGITKCSYDPKEWSCFDFAKISKNSDIKWKKKLYFSHKKRIIKSTPEIELLEMAVDTGRMGFERAKELFLVSGIGEDEYKLKRLAREAMSDYGKFELSFEPIVAIGANASKPHATPTDDELGFGDLLLMDAGVKFANYCSDRTRTINFVEGFDWDERQKFTSPKLQRIYDTVQKAHDKAIKKARVGMRAKDIDKIAREVIEKAGFGKYFVHSTGHGVGLDIHEMPYISPRDKTIIEDGMVFTIEPGIYLEGKFGVRIEDMVVMENGRARVL